MYSIYYLLILIQFVNKIVIKVWSLRNRQSSFYLQRSNDLSHVAKQKQNSTEQKNETFAAWITEIETSSMNDNSKNHLVQNEIFMKTFLSEILHYYYYYRYHRKI